jgi:hypothetical protein
LLAVPFYGLISDHIYFRIVCWQSSGEKVYKPVAGVNGILFQGSGNLSWMTYMVEKGGYSFAEWQTGRDEYLHQYLDEDFFMRMKVRQARGRQVQKPESKFVIQIEKTFLRSFVVKNEFVARETSSNSILGSKTVVFYSGGLVSRLLYWIFTILPDNGGYTCPSIASESELLDFFPKKVLIPSG